MIYKITNTEQPNWSGFKSYNSLAEAQLAVSAYGPTFSVVEADAVDQIHEKPTEQKIKERIQERKAFGQALEDLFLYDNAMYFATRGTPVTKAESKSLRTKTKDAWENAKVGSLEVCLEELQDIVVDTIFTQERKDKYITMINNYLNG